MKPIAGVGHNLAYDETEIEPKKKRERYAVNASVSEKRLACQTKKIGASTVVVHARGPWMRDLYITSTDLNIIRA